MPSRDDLVEKILQYRASSEHVEPSYAIAGTSSLEALGKLFFQQYRISLVFPQEHKDDLVRLYGAFTEDQLRDSLEQQLKCECVVFGSLWNLVWSDEGFTLVAPRFDESFSAGGVSADIVAGKFVITGKSDSSALARRLISQLSQPRDMIRIRFLFLDDSRLMSLGVQDSGPGLTIHLGPGADLSWSSDMLIDAFVDSGAVVNSWAGVYQDGISQTYQHTTEYLLPVYQTNDSGKLLEGTYEKNQAGLTLDLMATNLDGFWRLKGKFEVSEFLGTSQTATQRRSASIDIDVSPGSAVNLVSVTSDRGSISAGLRSNLYGFSSSTTSTTFSLWCIVESVQTVGVPESPATVQMPRHSSTEAEGGNGALRGGTAVHGV